MTHQDINRIRKLYTLKASSIPNFIDTKNYLDKSVWEFMKSIYCIMSKLSVNTIVTNKRINEVYIEYKDYMDELERFCPYDMLLNVSDELYSTLEYTLELCEDYELYEMAANFKKFKDLSN